MNGDRQDQRVGEGGQAIQAGNNVTIYQGVSPTQIAEILALNIKMIEQYQLSAKAEAEERFQNIEEKIQKKFADKEAADAEAFKDPDFQFVVREVQESYVRTGDENVGDTLVNLLAQRSLIKERNLTRLVLNDAVEVAGKVARVELAILTVSFLLLTVQFGIFDASSLIRNLKLHMSEFIDYLPEGDGSYGYLAGLGCIEREYLVHRTLHDILVESYGGILNDGFTQAEFDAAIGDKLAAAPLWKQLVKQSEIQNMVFTTVGFQNGNPIFAKPDGNRLYKFNFSNSTAMERALTDAGIDPSIRQSLGNLMTSKTWTKDYLLGKLRDAIPNVDVLYNRFDGNALGKISLTTKGIALAHSNLMHAVPIFKAPLSIWVS